jgi:hypothetical protein
MTHPRRRLALLWLATLTPAVLIAILIAQNAVDLPHMDDWSLSSGTLILARTGCLGWSSLIAQHNESRPLFPRLVFLTLGTLSRGDVRWQLWFNFALACAVSYCVFRLAEKTVTAAPWPLLGLTFLANLLIFTPKQAETWLWSTYVGLEPIACLCAALALLLSDLGGRRKLVLPGALCTVATFSYANGLSTWLVAAPLVTVVLGRRAFAWWGLGLPLNAAAYFYGYTRPGHHPRLVEGLQPVRLAHYQLAFAGSPWGIDRLSVATVIGAVLLACFASAVGC